MYLVADLFLTEPINPRSPTRDVEYRIARVTGAGVLYTRGYDSLPDLSDESISDGASTFFGSLSGSLLFPAELDGDADLVRLNNMLRRPIPAGCRVRVCYQMISEVAADTSARGRAYAYTKVSFQVRDLILIEQPALAARA